MRKLENLEAQAGRSVWAVLASLSQMLITGGVLVLESRGQSV